MFRDAKSMFRYLSEISIFLAGYAGGCCLALSVCCALDACASDAGEKASNQRFNSMLQAHPKMQAQQVGQLRFAVVCGSRCIKRLWPDPIV
jgi:hypothetical protein